MNAVIGEGELSRRDQILQVATKLFARLGYRNTDVQFVADELGIGKGTIYRQFPTKQDLFLAAVDKGMDELSSYTHERVAGCSDPPLERLKTAVRGYFEFFEKNPELVSLFVLEMAEFKDREKTTFQVYRERVADRSLQFFQELTAEKSVRNFPPKKLVEIMCSLMYGTIFTHRLMGDKRPLTEKAEDIIDVVIEGMLLKSSASAEVQ